MKWKRPRALKIYGAGDLVEIVAKPIAGLIDTVFDTHISNCSACEKRRKRLNELLPFEDPDELTPS